ncbi:MAG: Gfo/Idh/MocA family oxidoreductase [Anaerolineae bacterium]
MPARLNFGVIGFGRMGQLYAQTVVTQIKDVNLLAVADPNPDLQAAAEAEYAIPHVLPDARDLLAVPGLDAVIIASPTSAHCDHVIAAAEAGLAIFSEKPLALTLAQTRAAIGAVEKAGIPLQVGFMRRFDAPYRRAKQLIADGKIGRPVTFKSVGRDPFCPRVEFADPAKSGGLIVDMGIHDFDLARWLVDDEVERVSTEGTLMVCETLKAVGDIDNAVVNLRYHGGAIGNVEVSRNAFYGYDIRTEVLGSEGAVTIGGYQHTPVLLLTREGAQHDVVPYLMERFGAAYRAQVQDFADRLRRAELPAVGGADALAALEIGVAATQSLKSGQPVALAGLEDLAQA